MMKSAKTIFVVESVDKAIKFYTEKLGFDVVDLSSEKENIHFLNYAELRKGKAYLIFRVPSIEELADFSMVKRCLSRGVGLHVEMKKGIEKYFSRCQKKNVPIISPLAPKVSGDLSFSARDPFGMRLVFVQPGKQVVNSNLYNFCGMDIPSDARERSQNEAEILEKMISWLKGFGILRRAGKKCAKTFLKRFKTKKKKSA